MTHKKLRRLAALTSALLAANATTAPFAVNAAGSAGFNSVIKTSETDNVSYINGKYTTLSDIEDTDRYELSIESQPEKTVYLTGEELDFTGLEFCCLHQSDPSAEIWEGDYFDTYDTPLSELIESGKIIIDDSEFDNTKAGFYNIYIIYGNVTESIRVRVKEVREQDKIEITSEPSNTLIKLGEELDLSGTSLLLKDKETNEKTEYYDIYKLIDNGTITVDTSALDNTTEGIYPIFITYDGETVEFDVRVYEYHEGYTLNIFDDTIKKVYKIGEELDLMRTKFRGTYNNNFKHGDFFYSDLVEYIEKGTLTLDDSEFDNTKAGTYTIYVHYGTATDSFNVVVTDGETASSDELTIHCYPFRNDFDLNMALDLSGAVVSGKYGENNEFHGEDLTDMIEKGIIDVDCSEYNSSEIGTYKIYIILGTAIESFEVRVGCPPVINILNIETLPIKTEYYCGEELDLTGATVYCWEMGDGDKIPDIDFTEDLQTLIDNETVKIDYSEFDNTTPGIYTIRLNYGHAWASFDVAVAEEYIMKYSIHIEKSGLTPDIYQIMFNDFDYYELYSKYIISGSSYLVDKDGNEFNKTEFENKPLLEMIENGTVTAELSKVYHSTHPGSGKRGIERELRVNYGNGWDILIFGMSNIEEQPSIEWKKQPQKAVYTYGEELDLRDAEVTLFDTENEDSEGISGKLSDFIADGTVQINADRFYNCTEGKCTIFLGYNDGYIEYDVEVLPEVPDGDANGDGKLTIADMVMVQKHIMGKKSAALSDWKCADLYEDGKIDVYDFIVMRENFVEKMK